MKGTPKLRGEYLGEVLRNTHKSPSSLAKDKEGPRNKKNVFFVGMESDWTREYKQNCNEICAYIFNVMVNKAFCSALPAQDRIFHGEKSAPRTLLLSTCGQGISYSVRFENTEKDRKGSKGQAA